MKAGPWSLGGGFPFPSLVVSERPRVEAFSSCADSLLYSVCSAGRRLWLSSSNTHSRPWGLCRTRRQMLTCYLCAKYLQNLLNNSHKYFLLCFFFLNPIAHGVKDVLVIFKSFNRFFLCCLFFRESGLLLIEMAERARSKRGLKNNGGFCLHDFAHWAPTSSLVWLFPPFKFLKLPHRLIRIKKSVTQKEISLFCSQHVICEWLYDCDWYLISQVVILIS